MLEDLEFMNVVKVSRNSLENLLQNDLCGDFMDLSVEDDEFEVRVHYDDNEAFKNEVLNVLKLEITDIQAYKETVIDDNSSKTSDFDFYITYVLGDLKKFLSKNIGKNIVGEFYSDIDTENLVFVIEK